MENLVKISLKKTHAHLFVFILLALCTSVGSAMADSCSRLEVNSLVGKIFADLGHDCKAYASLFSEDARYYHQHDGYKKASELLTNCQNYAAFCPGNECRFLQNGAALMVPQGESCHLLIPYLWSEIPANSRAKDNLEPHTGWEYVIVGPGIESSDGYRIKHFAELESTYSVAFNWAKPDDTPAVVAQSTLHLLSLSNSASKGECNNPIAPILTKFFNDKSSGGEVWRQQGDAVVLATGGVCHVTVPYSAQVGDKLKTGQFVFVLQPLDSSSYLIDDKVEFSRALL